MRALRRGASGLIRVTLHFRYLSLSVAFVAFAVAVVILGVSIAGIAPLVRIKFFPDDYTLYYAFADGPANTTIEKTDEMTREIARYIMADGPGHARSAAGFAGFAAPRAPGPKPITAIGTRPSGRLAG